MTKKYVGENDSNSIKVLYDYCSRIDWHIFLKRIVDISYFINLKIFFLGSEGLCCYPEKKKEYIILLRGLINLYMLEQKKGIQCNGEVWRGVTQEELELYLNNPEGYTIRGPISCCKNFKSIAEYAKKHNGADHVIRFLYNGTMLDVNNTTDVGFPNEKEFIVSGKYGSLVVKSIKKTRNSIKTLGGPNIDVYEAILEDRIPTIDSRNGNQEINQAWNFINNYECSVIDYTLYVTEKNITESKKIISCPEAITLFKRGKISKDVFTDSEFVKWKDSMDKFLDLFYIRAHNRVEKSKPDIKELNTSYDEMVK